MAEHGCTEGKRFDRIEELLTKLSDLLVSNATCDIRIDHTEDVGDWERRAAGRLVARSFTHNRWLFTGFL